MLSGYPDLAVMGSRQGSGQVDTEPPVRCVVQSTPVCGLVQTTTNTVGLVHAADRPSFGLGSSLQANLISSLYSVLLTIVTSPLRPHKGSIAEK